MAINKSKVSRGRAASDLRSRRPASNGRASNAASKGNSTGPCGDEGLMTRPTIGDVWIDITVLLPVLPGTTVAGLKLAVAPTGRPATVKLTVLV